MTTFQDRERAFEAKFSHDEEFRFLVLARRDKLFAKWVAGQLRLSGQAEADLITSVLAVRDGAGHDDLLLKHVAKAFSRHGRIPPTGDFATMLNRCEAQARQQLLEGPRVF